MRLLKLYLLIIIAALIGNMTVSAQKNENTTLTYQDFYNTLSPYGKWIDYPKYGQIWSPDVNNFRPYATNGHWEYTDNGWYWNSDYEWGWAPFHYGSWLYDDSYGWLWVPGYTWAPAWVTWGEYDDFYAWAPISPDAYTEEFRGWRPPYDYYWNMVKKEDITSRDINNKLISESIVRNNAEKLSQVSRFRGIESHTNRSNGRK